MKAFLQKTLLFLVLLLVPSLLGAAYAYRQYVVLDPGPEFEREAILGVIAQESPIFYRDGKTRIGAFFDSEHRTYVPYAELPKDWVDAIVAAEDGDFFEHPGIAPKHIVRAALQNLQAGKVVAGGSTLTQQTAKNLFYRPDRSFRSKVTEFVNALRLEAHFSKQDILEFYANQFHVSANGRGLGVAARYFFDKSPSELSLKESAFLAGFVKAPARYNPFLGETAGRRDEARRAAEERTAYVLRRMEEEGMLAAGRLPALLAEPLEFRRGAFQYDSSVIVDEVQRRLEQPAFVELFERLGIDNPSTAGLQIVTTLDERIQTGATYALWHHLTEVGAVLERKGADALRLPAATVIPPAAGAGLAPGSFVTARVMSVTPRAIELDAGGARCTVDYDGVERVAAVVARSRRGAGEGAADAASRAAVRAALPSGSIVLASVRPDSDAAQPLCDLEIRPQLQGAAVVLEEGALRAFVGGNDNRNFNRALNAQRQFGSTWKPFVYAAALQLGWLPDDVLDNRLGVFPFRGVFYYPRPDHVGTPWVTMSMAGARSENMASVWLLAHLVDHLSAQQLLQLAAMVGLGRGPDESGEDWVRRLQRDEQLAGGVERAEERAFLLAREELLAGPALVAHPEDASHLRSLHHGRGFAAERARQLAASRGAVGERLTALDHSFLALEDSLRSCLEANPSATWCGTPPPTDPALPAAVDSAGVPSADAAAVVGPDGTVAPDAASADATIAVPSPEPGASVDAAGPAPEVFGSPDAADAGAVPPDEIAAEGPQMLDPLVNGVLHASTIRALRSAIDRHLPNVAARDPWDPQNLTLDPDFRTLVGIRYVQRMIDAYGVSAELPTSLVLALGAADVSLVDATSLYAGFLEGERWFAEGSVFEAGMVPGTTSAVPVRADEAGPALIAEIRDAGGNLVYSAATASERVADPMSGALVGDILRNVVRHGTARRAAGREARNVPLAGKTGTTNDYRNAAFIGFVPRPVDRAYRWGDAYSVGVYVGYDDNTSMRRGGLRLQGANGALPAWLGIARTIGDTYGSARGKDADYELPEGIVRVPLGGGAADGSGAGPSAWTVTGSARRFVPFAEEPKPVVGFAAVPVPAALDAEIGDASQEIAEGSLTSDAASPAPAPAVPGGPEAAPPETAPPGGPARVSPGTAAPGLVPPTADGEPSAPASVPDAPGL
jgi:penicillin-binding protein 1A